MTTRARDDLTVTTTAPASEASLGELVSTATRDLSELLHKEVELAKLEIKHEVVTAGKGAGMLGGAGVSAAVGLLFLEIALAFALGRVMPLGAGFAVVGALHLAVAALLAVTGKSSLSRLGPPRRTIDTVKDDLAWAKHPTKAP